MRVFEERDLHYGVVKKANERVSKKSEYKQSSRKTFKYGESLEGIKVGDYLVLGEYPFAPNGDKKPLQWIVMDIENDKLFLISRYVIDIMKYHKNSKQKMWYASEVRKWLNSEFIRTSIPSEFLGNIIPTRIKYQVWSAYFTNVENYNFCTDKVFLIGYEEILKYWPTPSYAKDKKIGEGVPYSKRKATLTPYAKTKKYIDPIAIKYGCRDISNYLLRDNEENHICCVISKPAFASVNYWGFYSHQNSIPDGIRPAMWVKK